VLSKTVTKICTAAASIGFDFAYAGQANTVGSAVGYAAD